MQDGEYIQSKAHTAGRTAPGWLKGYREAAGQLPGQPPPLHPLSGLLPIQEVE